MVLLLFYYFIAHIIIIGNNTYKIYTVWLIFNTKFSYILHYFSIKNYLS